MTPRRLLGVALPAGAFGIATVVSGGRVLFGPDPARAAAGQVVPSVLVLAEGEPAVPGPPAARAVTLPG